MALAIAIITLIVAVIGIPTAIFQLRKAYIEKKNASNGKEKSRMSNSVKGSSITNKSDIGSGNSILTVGDNTSITISTPSSNPSIVPSDVSDNDENIILKDNYTSLFAERGEVHSEKITIKNLGNGKIEGDVFLDDNNTYKLTGTFKNRVLTGEFTSTGRYTDERGTINIKLISENILSGFCSFSKITTVEDQIRMSPYVWVAGNNSELIHGTYKFCTDCHNEGKKCCCSSDDIDMPVLLRNEAEKLQAKNPRHQRMRDFSHNIGNTPIRQINAVTKGNNNLHCHFYDVTENRCKIYEIRPTDCRLFPFDIKLDPNTNEYWVGYYDDLCERQLPTLETMKQYAHVLRPQLFLLFPYANTINDSTVCKELQKASFKKLYRLEEFVF